MQHLTVALQIAGKIASCNMALSCYKHTQQKLNSGRCKRCVDVITYENSPGLGNKIYVLKIDKRSCPVINSHALGIGRNFVDSAH